MKRYAILAAILLSLSGCVAMPSIERYERTLTQAAKPCYVISKGQEKNGLPCVTVMDAYGRVTTLWGAWTAGFEVGEVIDNTGFTFTK